MRLPASILRIPIEATDPNRIPWGASCRHDTLPVTGFDIFADMRGIEPAGIDAHGGFGCLPQVPEGRLFESPGTDTNGVVGIKWTESLITVPSGQR